MRSTISILVGVLGTTFADVVPILAQEPSEYEERTVDWFAHHPAGMARVLTACHDDPKAAQNTPDCVNAERAARLSEERRSQSPE